MIYKTSKLHDDNDNIWIEVSHRPICSDHNYPNIPRRPHNIMNHIQIRGAWFSPFSLQNEKSRRRNHRQQGSEKSQDSVSRPGEAAARVPAPVVTAKSPTTFGSDTLPRFKHFFEVMKFNDEPLEF
jgi:hypothetical protein